jgi:NAD(P)-dependent dehydrogenase (short-subunit alcohol dehydrogenase family)
MERLQGKVAIVTGAAQGIGRATAELFSREGADVYAVDLQPTDPFDPALKIRYATLDVVDAPGWRDLVRTAHGQSGAVDVLVNNAGTGGAFLPLLEESREGWDQVVAVNQTGTFLGMQSVLPGMRERGRGAIVNLASIWGVSAVAFAAAYQATKGAIRMLTKHAAVTYAADGVRVNSIMPGIVATPTVLNFQDEATSAAIIGQTPMGRMAQPLEIAQGILFLASDEASFMTGAELVIDGGYLSQ